MKEIDYENKSHNMYLSWSLLLCLSPGWKSVAPQAPSGTDEKVVK